MQKSEISQGKIKKNKKTWLLRNLLMHRKSKKTESCFRLTAYIQTKIKGLPEF